MKERPYQRDAIGSVFDGFASHASQLLVMATGLGKTVVMSSVAKRWREEKRPGRVLMLAHREELIAQAKGKFDAMLSCDCDVEMATLRDQGYSPACLASVQSLSQAGRLGAVPPGRYGLLMIDEAHHSVASTYRRVIDHLRKDPALRLLGVTATPKRADELAMGQIYDHCCYDYGIEPAVEDGWLVPVVQRAVKVHGLDFSKARQTAGDLNEGDLEAIMKEEKILHQCVAPTVELAGEKPCLIFAVTVAHAHALAAVLDRYKRGSAVALDGKTDPMVRREQVERFRRGQIQFLVNCGLFLEGFDAPATAVVVMARPTKSLSLYVQILGRGTRALPGVVDDCADSPEARRAAIAESGKPFMTVLDFVGNSGRHKIVTAADVLGGRYGQPVKDYAAKLTLSSADRKATVADVLAQAADEVALLDEIRERERRRAVRAKAEFDAQRVNPFLGGAASSAAERAAPAVPCVPITEKQINYLVWRAGWSRQAALKLGKTQASAIIGRHRESEAAAS